MGRRARQFFGTAGCWTLLALTASGANGQTSSETRSSDLIRGSVSSSNPVPRRIEYAIASSTAPISIDGRLDDAGWSSAVVVPLPYEVSPAENGIAPVSTECRITRDAQNLYLGCTARDRDPDAIRAYVVDRDRTDGHDRIVLTLDPFNDQRRAFQFGVSALGVQSDAVLAQQGAGNPMQGPDALPIDPSWDAIWSSAGAITSEGYVVEASIPFRSLRFPSSSDDTAWGAYITRWWPRSANVEIRSAPWDRSDSCLLCQAHLFTGIRGVSGGTNVQLTPTFTVSRSDTRTDFPAGAMVPGPADRDVGVDAQWGLTSDLTLNATVNPDFSQVEADVAQLDVNNRFALFFPETRPFFLEGADFFGTPIQAVFSRSISDPIGGAKITGKLGSNAVGLLLARDRTNNLVIPGSQFSSATSLDSEVTTAVARFRHDVGGTSTVGALITGREGAGYHNRVGGVDAFYRPLASLTVQAQLLRSETEYPHTVAESFAQREGAFSGNAANTRVNWTSSNWTLGADGRYLDPGFRADAGFVTQSGIRSGNANLARRWWGGADRWFTQIRVNVGTWRTQDFDGRQMNGGGWLGLEYRGPSQSHIGIFPNFAMKEHFAGVTYEGMKQLWFSLSAAPSGTLSMALNGVVGDAIDFANARLGSETRLSPSATLRLGRNTEARLQHTYQRLTRSGAEVFTANLSQIRGVYNFSARSFFRAVLQYQHTDRSLDQYVGQVDRSTRALLMQLLYAYKVNPQTVLFLGYAQDGDGLVDAERMRVPLTTRGRTFFLKLGYAWRP